MTTWWHHPTIFNLRLNKRLATRVLCILLLSIALITTLFLNVAAHAAPGVNQTVGFQGRLLDVNGDIVRDGYYNVQFKIYQGGTGEQAGNPGGTLQWTETYINNGNTTGAVEVKNGFLSVNLGSINPFGTSVDWNQDTLWLSMNIAGASTSCTTFGAGACAADGEMLPMKRMTATPFALNSAAVNGKTADNFVQLAQGVQNDATNNTSSIFINKTGTGNLMQLQNTATDIFTIGNTGNLTLGSNADKSISLATSSANEAGKNLSVVSGAGGSGAGSAGGNLTLQGGAAGGTNGNGGNVSIEAGAKTGTGTDGSIAIGTANTSNVTIGSGSGSIAGSTTLQAKNAVTIETNGTTRATFSDSSNTAYFGNGVSAAAPNDYTLQATNSSASGVNGGSLSIQGGSATTGNANGGNVTLGGGTGSGTGANGLVVLNTPTFATTTSDTSCYTGGAVVAASCTVSAASVNNSASVIIGFSATGQTATIPDPTITTAGRILYVTAAADSKDFSLSVNGGTTGNLSTMRHNTTTTLLWNGSDWTIAGASNYGVNVASNVSTLQVGSGADDGTTTLLTLDKAASAPSISNSALFGSMYYDTTLGKVQCYEADGWGACSASPDTIVSLNPEYANSVINGTGSGTLTSDFCSDALDINDGTSGQQTFCGPNQTFNLYSYFVSSTTQQTRSIFVNYQLPANFKNFTPGSTSLMAARTPSATTNYQIYKSTPTGLIACGDAMPVTTDNTWQKLTASGTSDPANCSFAAGDSVIFKLTLSARSSARSLVSTINFAYKNE